MRTIARLEFVQIQELPAGIAIGQVQTDPFDRTRRHLGTQVRGLPFDEDRIVNLDPVKGRGRSIR